MSTVGGREAGAAPDVDHRNNRDHSDSSNKSDNSDNGDNRGPVPRALIRRIAITIGCAAVALGVLHIPIPGLRVDALVEQAGQRWDMTAISIGSLGVRPVLTAFLLVELAALLVPRWRPLLHGGPDGRRRLLKATLILGLALALLQGWFAARWIESLSYGFHGWGPSLLAWEGMRFLAITTVTLATGVMLYVALALVIDRAGLGGGFSMLIAISALWEARDLAKRIWTGLELEELGALSLLVLATITGVMVLVTLKALRRREEPAGDRGPALRLPSSGIEPLQVASGLLMLPASSAAVFASAALSQVTTALAADSALYLTVYAALAAPLAIGLGVLFHRIAPMAALASRAGEGSSPDEAALRGARRTAILHTLLFLGALVALWHLTMRASRLSVEPVLVVIITAVTLDLRGEWLARRRLGDDLVSVWPIHRVWAAHAALAALERAGIPAHARSLHHRSLWYFFAPYIPIDVLVPRERAADADRVLSSLFLPAPGSGATDGSPPVSTPG